MADFPPLKTPGAIVPATGTDVALIGGARRPVGELTFEDSVAGLVTLSTLLGGGPPSGAASGDLGGTYPAPDVVAIRGQPVSVVAPTVAYVLTWDGAKWEAAVGGGGSPLDPELEALIGQTGTTGVLTGMVTTRNAGDATKFDIGVGLMSVVDSHTDPTNPVLVVVNIAAPVVGVARTTGLESPPAESTYLAYNAAGTLLQQSTPFAGLDIRTKCQFAALWHPGGDGADIIALGPDGFSGQNAALEPAWLLDLLGAVREDGVLFGPSGANLNLNRSVGTIRKAGLAGWDTIVARQDPSVAVIAADTELLFYRSYRSSGGNGLTTDAGTTVFVPNAWDNASGVLQSFPGSDNFGVARLYIGPKDPATGDTVSVLAPTQATYRTVEDALNAVGSLAFEERDFLRDFVFCSWLVHSKSATDLSDTSQAAFFAVPPLFRAGGGGVTANSAVTTYDGLTDTPPSPKPANALVASNAGATALEYLDTLAALNTKLDVTLDANTASRPPNGAASGDLASTYPAPTVVGLRSQSISAVAATEGQVLASIAGVWTPTTGGSGVTTQPMGARTRTTSFGGIGTTPVLVTFDQQDSDVGVAFFTYAAGVFTANSTFDCLIMTEGSMFWNSGTEPNCGVDIVKNDGPVPSSVSRGNVYSSLMQRNHLSGFTVASFVATDTLKIYWYTTIGTISLLADTPRIILLPKVLVA